MRRAFLFLPLPLLIAGCGGGGGPAGNAMGAATNDVATAASDVGNSAPGATGGDASGEGAVAATPAPTPAPASGPATPAAPGTPGGLDDDRTPIGESPQPETSAQGAATVVERYYALIEAGRYRQAYDLWEPGRAGMTAAQFARSFDRYAEYHAQVGAPGRIEGAAGSRYVQVPVQPYGRLKEGNRPFNMRGSMTLRRVAEVPGSTAAQRRWHITDTSIKPRPGEPAPQPTPSPRATEDNRSVATYRCDGGVRLTARFDSDRGRVTVLRDGQRLARLRQRPAGSGILYEGGGYELRAKGTAMTFTQPDAQPLSCRAQVP
ncbi:MliC family protein [Sphingomonas sp.]|uniref:MliC family protein n=1 Tax=Sphingomonas sp. TaxID=28214 RepID=UPI001EBD6409|nr:MliC family protein [Sphingomonas sp.]MBX3595880.1 MliC family protein [Sphingomonas sp.]